MLQDYGNIGNSAHLDAEYDMHGMIRELWPLFIRQRPVGPNLLLAVVLSDGQFPSPYVYFYPTLQLNNIGCNHELSKYFFSVMVVDI